MAVETGRAMLFPEGERPDSFWWTCPRQKTRPMVVADLLMVTLSSDPD